MVTKTVRIILALLYGAAFALFLTRCSPNVSSFDRSILRGQSVVNEEGGTIINVDSNSLSRRLPALKVHFVNVRELRNLARSAKNDETRVSISGRGSAPSDLDELKKSGSTEVSLEESSNLYPAEAWIALQKSQGGDNSETEECQVQVHPSGENQWKISVSECAHRSQFLQEIEAMSISFRAKDPTQWINTTI